MKKCSRKDDHLTGSEGEKSDIMVTDSMNSVNIANNLDAVVQAALDYHAKGWQIVPVPKGSKAPYRKDWLATAYESEDVIRSDFHGMNVGVVQGTRSGIMDVDLDDPRGAKIAERLMSPTPALFGRAGKPDSHRVYAVRSPGKMRQYKDPITKTMLVELRGDGAQSVFPGSVHASGEPITWRDPEDTTPTPVNLGTLREQTGRVAAAILLARHYPEPGARHEPMLALAGYLARRPGWEDDDILAFCESVSIAAGDEKVRDRMGEVATTVARFRDDEHEITGLPTLVDYYPEAVIISVKKWLSSEGERGEQRPLESNNCIVICDSEGKEIRLANFIARVAVDASIDYGEEVTERKFRIVGKREDGTPFARAIAAEDFPDNRKLLSALQAAGGAKLIVYKAEYVSVVRRFMQEHPGIEERSSYGYTGWIDCDGQRAFLAPRGGMGAAGASLEIPLQLQRYGVQEVSPETLQHIAGVWIEDGLQVFGKEVTYLLAGTLFLTPAHAALPVTQKYVTHLRGETGVKKTAYALAAMGMYGDFAEPPETWQSTINSIEMTGYYLKDLPLLVDDFKQGTVQSRSMVQLIQRHSDAVGRNRLRADIKQVNRKPMRGLLISTGEDSITEEASVKARMIELPIARGECDERRLSTLQQHAHLLPGLGYAYLAWLAREWEGVVREEAASFHEYRDGILADLRADAPGATNDARVAANFAQNTIGFQLMLRFLTASGLLSADIAERMGTEYQAIRRTLAAKAAGAVTQERASTVFLNTLSDMLATGRVKLATRGNQEHTFTPYDDTTSVAPASPYAPTIGWQDEKGVYLTTAAYTEVHKYVESGGRALSFSQEAIYAQLDADGVIAEKGRDRAQKVIKVDGKAVRVLHLRTEVFTESALAEG